MKKVKSDILNKEFLYKPTHLILTVSNKLWLHDKWNIRINNETFEYSTGIGLRNATPSNKKEYKRLIHMTPKRTKENLQMYVDQLEVVSFPVAPTIDDVLFSLVMDSEAVEFSFDEWCDNYGYDTHSKKAESIYNTCLTNAKKVQSLGIDIEQARELFQDY